LFHIYFTYIDDARSNTNQVNLGFGEGQKGGREGGRNEGNRGGRWQI
jgi:hypothetical protein